MRRLGGFWEDAEVAAEPRGSPCSNVVRHHALASPKDEERFSFVLTYLYRIRYFSFEIVSFGKDVLSILI